MARKRRKYKKTDAVITGVWKSWNSPSSYIEGMYSATVPTHYEWITCAKTRKQDYNPCQHFRNMIEYFPRNCDEPWGSPPESYHTEHNNIWFDGLPGIPPILTQDTNILSRNLVPVQPEIIEQFVAQGVEQMKPSLDSGFSLGNFIAEMREIRTMFKWLFVRYGPLSRGRRRRVDLFHNANLSYNFGIKPLLNDLRDIVSNLLSFQDRITSFLDRAGRCHTSHTVAGLPWYGGELSNTSDSTHTYRSEWLWPNAKITCTMMYMYKLEELRSYLQRLGAVLDVFGLKVTPKAIWNGLPFSFVIDWVVDISGLLSQFDYDYTPVETFISWLGVSVKYSGTLQHSWKYYGVVCPNNPLRVYRKQHIKYYTRHLTVPPLTSFPIRPGDLSPKHLVLGYNLLQTRARRR